MSNGSTVTASAFSAFANSGVQSKLAIGGQSHVAPEQDGFGSIWLIVADLANLEVVASGASTDGSTVPRGVARHAGDSRYFLYAISNQAWAPVVPRDDLRGLLQSAGAGPQLARLEQIHAQLGTAYLGDFSYILAATMAEDDKPGFEALSLSTFSILTMGFLPVTVDGQTTYAPIRTGPA